MSHGDGWARITLGATPPNPAPFCVHVRCSLSSFLRRAHLRVVKKNLQMQDVGIVRENSADAVDLSVRLRRNALTAEQDNPFIAAHNVKEAWVSISSDETRTDVEAIESAAQFHMHLYDASTPRSPSQTM